MQLSVMPSFNFLKDFSQPFDGYNAFFFRISVTLLHLCVCVCVCVCVCIHSLALFPSPLCCSLFSNDFSQFLKDLPPSPVAVASTSKSTPSPYHPLSFKHLVQGATKRDSALVLNC